MADLCLELRLLAHPFTSGLDLSDDERRVLVDAAEMIESLRGRFADGVTLDDGVGRLRAAGDALVAAMRSGSDAGWDAAIDAWESARAEG